MPLPEAATVRDALRYGSELLATREDIREWAARDAQLLLAAAMQCERARLIAWPEHVLSAEQDARFEGMLRARLQAVPMQHLRGEQEFYGRSFSVTKDVLIPRPETELLIDEVLKLVPRDAPLRIADVGTGSGAIAITLAAELPLARVTAVDLSSAALTIALANAERLGVAERIRFIECDLLRGVDGGFDCIVSNPPYIPERDRETLHAQVREWEPSLALFGGADGMDVYRRLIPQAWERLREGGWLLMEIGDRIDSLLDGWSGVRTVLDLEDRPRVVLAQKI